MLKEMLEANLTLPLFQSNRDKDYFRVALFTHHLLDQEDFEWLKQFKNYRLSDDEAKALVVLRKVGIINNWMYRVTNNVDTLTASQHLRRLRDAGLLEQQGKGAATCYTLASALQPEQVDKNACDNSNLESSTPDNGVSGKQDHFNLESSTTDNSLSGKQDLSNLESPKESELSVQLSLDFSSPQSIDKAQIPECLKKQIDNLDQRSESEELKTVIIELCRWSSLSAKELSHILNRKHKYLLDDYLKPLIDEGKLQYTYPDNPKDPRQSYKAL